MSQRGGDARNRKKIYSLYAGVLKMPTKRLAHHDKERRKMLQLTRMDDDDDDDDIQWQSEAKAKTGT